ncbi:MAG: hypothetical protein AAF682_27985 [Planctomycetota bacterium]
MRPSTPLRLLALAAPLLLGACTSYDFVEQDVLLHHDAETDELELLLVYEDLRETDSKSAAVVAADGGGAQHFILAEWPWELFLDDLDAELGAKDNPLSERARAFFAGVRVAEAELFRRADGALCLYQRVRMRGASEGLGIVDDALTELVLALDEEYLAASWEPGTAALLVEHARAARPWFRFEGGALIAQLPLTPAGAAQLLPRLLESAHDGARLHELFAPLSELSWRDDGLCTLRFAPDAEGWIRLRFRKPDRAELAPIALDADVRVAERPPEAAQALLR